MYCMFQSIIDPLYNHQIDKYNSESTNILTDLADTYVDNIYFEAAHSYYKSMVTDSEYKKGLIMELSL